ncbi:helix-turn-helix domain-containing protein [Gammaproteobacteria bacterium]|nr:helix-turn-helix domain-containing protein [Gammaproteobacteria bacterium]
MSLKSAHTGKVGKAFQNARILLSLTVEDVAHQTLINIEYIKAIESGDYAVFPARMFAVKYFEKYAKFLNLEISFFDIYNADVVAAANKELQSDLPDPSFMNMKKKMIYIFFICFFLLLSIFFIFIESDDPDKLLDTKSMESMIQPLATESKIIEEFHEEINKLHDEINNFFIQDKLDSVQLGVNVDSSEPET